MNPRYSKTEFLISAAKVAQCPADEGAEVAFVGRSNAGKSSAINTLCHQKNLARTSKTPGRTQLLNFFQLEEGKRLVDLPGYGFAKVSEKKKNEWQRELAAYLQQRQCLHGLVLLMDIRHPLKDFDTGMLSWCVDMKLPVHVLLTKSDKLKRGAASKSLLTVKAYLKQLDGEFSVQTFSSLNKQGLDALYVKLDEWLFSEEQG